MNTDLESDCETIISISKTNRHQSQNNSTATIQKTNLSRGNAETGGTSSTKTNNTQKKTDTSNLFKVIFSFILKDFFLI